MADQLCFCADRFIVPLKHQEFPFLVASSPNLFCNLHQRDACFSEEMVVR